MRIALILISVVLSCNLSNKKNASTANINKIEINYVHLDIETTVRVNCSDFYGYFGTVSKKELKSDEEISTFLKYFEANKKKAKIFKGKMDARGEIIINYKDGKKDKVCIGYYLTKIDTVVYYNTEKFEKYLEALLE